MARLHDLGDNSSAALDLYQARLKNVTEILTAAGAAKKVVYALTTPQMQFEVSRIDPIVSELNARAAAVMSQAKVPVVDLYSRVKTKCGQSYTKVSEKMPMFQNILSHSSVKVTGLAQKLQVGPIF